MTQPKSFLRQFLSPWGWAALAALVGALLSLALAQWGAETARRLAEEGVDTTAEILTTRITSHRDSDGDTRHDYEVTFRFAVDGALREDYEMVSQSYYFSVARGDVVPLRYWRQDPSVSELEPGTAATNALIGQIATGITGVATLILGWLGWSRAAAAAWMHRHGVERRVTVTGHVDTSVKVNNVPRWRATWIEADGRPGRTRMARKEALPEVGSQITILVDPNARRPSMWQGDL